MKCSQGHPGPWPGHVTNSHLPLIHEAFWLHSYLSSLLDCPSFFILFGKHKKVQSIAKGLLSQNPDSSNINICHICCRYYKIITILSPVLGGGLRGTFQAPIPPPISFLSLSLSWGSVFALHPSYLCICAYTHAHTPNTEHTCAHICMYICTFLKFYLLCGYVQISKST